MYMGLVIATFYPMDPDFGFRGILFLAMTGIGFCLILGSGKTAWTWRSLAHSYDLLWYAVAVLAGIVLTFLVQHIALALPYMSNMASDARKVYLASAALSETYMYFGLQTFFAERFAWFVGLPIPSLMAYGTHQYVYGVSPEALWAVVLSFFVQAVLYEWTGRLSIPLTIHLVVNLL